MSIQISDSGWGTKQAMNDPFDLEYYITRKIELIIVTTITIFVFNYDSIQPTW